MSDYQRYFVAGGTYFFTVVTYDRRPILTTNHGRRYLRKAIQEVRRVRPFEIIATVLVPNHWHVIVSLPFGDSDYSTRLKRIKEEFTGRWLDAGLPECDVSPSQKRSGTRGIWQPRFWEHTIENEEDLERCVDYVHWNPRKHQLVDRVVDWPYSSFHRFVEAGHYDKTWGGTQPKSIRSDRSWGEP